MGRVWLSSVSWLQEKWAFTWASVASYDMPARKERDSWSKGSQSHLQESIGESSYATWTENNLYPNLLLEKENQGPQKIENWITNISECLYIYWGFFQLVHFTFFLVNVWICNEPSETEKAWKLYIKI